MLLAMAVVSFVRAKHWNSENISTRAAAGVCRLAITTRWDLPYKLVLRRSNSRQLSGPITCHAGPCGRVL